MTRTLRKKFIAFTMSAVTVLLIVLVGAINLLSYSMLDSQSDKVLDTLVQSDGMPKQMHTMKPPPFAPHIDMDMMQATRFFSVHVSDSGEIIKTDVDRISSVDESEAASLAKKITESGKSEGKISGYKYKSVTGTNETRIFFMDTTSQNNTVLTVLFASCGIAMLTWLVTLIFVILLSGKVVRPVIKNMEKQKQFITNAGHELKTPLAIIQTNNDALALIQGENKYTKNIRTQTHRLAMLMHNMLTLARLDEEVKFPTEDVDISELLEVAAEPYKEAACEKDLVFNCDISKNITLKANRELFMQLFSSLLDNAVKYTPSGGTVSVTLKEEGKHIILTEENTCFNDKNESPERLFERFYRSDDARTQDAASKGYGIGLSAARAICESFGGKLTAAYTAKDKICFTAKF